MKDTPEYAKILDGLYVGNLSAAKSLDVLSELGITHILSVCPDYPEDKNLCGSENNIPPITHRCIPIQDSESEDILIHLPSAVSFIKNAFHSNVGTLDCCGNEWSTNETGSEGDSKVTTVENAGTGTWYPRKSRVLVHCVMGISRSVTVICAYLMATRGISLEAAILFVRKRRPQAHPNYGFRRQLIIFAECGYFASQTGPVRAQPAYTSWLRRRKREASKYLARVENVVEIKFAEDEKTVLSFTDDFPTDLVEASSLLNEIEATHFLTISPATIPSIPSSPYYSPVLRPSIRPPPLISQVSSSSSNVSSAGLNMALSGINDSSFSSTPSSRSSSFSYGSRLSSPLAGPSTAATSVTSFSVPSKLRQEPSHSKPDEELFREPSWLEVAGVKHCHFDVSGSSPLDLLVNLSGAASFINEALRNSEQDSESCLNLGRKHILIHCTTESRGCAVVCAYLMSSRGMTPEQAYTVLEKALPLFNPTKSFLTLIELFFACECNPTEDHPLVRSWLADGLRHTVPGSSSCIISHNLNRSKASQQDEVDGSESDYDSCILRRKLGTPMRCGSLAASVAPSPRGSLSFSASVTGPSSTALANSLGSDLKVTKGFNDADVDKLLRRCAGVGDPKFTFDVEAFRGALRGIASAASASTDSKSVGV